MPGSSDRSKRVPKIAGSTAPQSRPAAPWRSFSSLRCQRLDADLGEQPAVEAVDPLDAERSAVAHRGQEGGQLDGKRLRTAGTHREEVGEQPAAQQPDVLGEEAEEELHQEVRRAVRFDVPRVQPGGEAPEPGRRFLGDGLGRGAGFERVGFVERLAEEVEFAGLVEVVEGDRCGPW